MLYTTPKENVKIDGKVPSIIKHIKKEGERSEHTTISKMETVGKYKIFTDKGNISKKED